MDDEIPQYKLADQVVSANLQVQVIDLTHEDDYENECIVPTTVDTLDTSVDQT